MKRLFVSLATALLLQSCGTGPSDGLTASPNIPEPAAPLVNPGSTVADYLGCLRDQDILMITAHRGGPAQGYPENALETFSQLLAHGPMLIETDVRMTKDGILVLMHDETLDRTTTGSGPVAEATLAEIKRLFLVDNEGQTTPYRVPTLAQALSWARGRAILQLDVKAGTPIDQVAAAVAQTNAQGFAAVIAYTIEDALAAAAVDPEVTVSVEIMDLDRLDRLVAAGLSARRMMAWTGVQTQRPSLWSALNDRQLSAAWGSLWYIDRQVSESGDASPFIRLAQSSLDILSSDLPRIAFDAVGEVQNTSDSVGACKE
ncbi:MAG: glycerophosphodiester phosphodiesterase family protein [Pseudomonadota bacterium]